MFCSRSVLYHQAGFSRTFRNFVLLGYKPNIIISCFACRFTQVYEFEKRVEIIKFDVTQQRAGEQVDIN